MTPTTKILLQPWMTDPAALSVMAPLAVTGATGPVALFVGGCVRDAILRRDVVDVDIATIHPPEEVMQRLDAAGIGYHTIGVEHGTVGAHADGRTFEITTLRVDVETDGRHATVAYTNDWALDASRRDFTMNALYADTDGNVFDPLGGINDLHARRIRFIGDPGERIKEDALRILRFFRFHAQLGETTFDSEGVAACAANAGLLSALSGERLKDELRKLLMADQSTTSIAQMVSHDILGSFLACVSDVARLSALVAVEDRAGDHAFERRLFALCNDASSLPDISQRLRFSKVEHQRLLRITNQDRGIEPGLPARIRMEKLYRLGRSVWRDLVIMNWAEAASSESPPSDAWAELLDFADVTDVPVFPLRGADVLDLGVVPGPEVSRLLKDVEVWWVEAGFATDRESCLAELVRLVGA